MHFKDMTPQQAFEALHRRANIALAVSCVSFVLLLVQAVAQLFTTGCTP